jgi:hypothetical protein
MATRISGRILVILVILINFLSTGCGSKSAVSGRVTVGGQPVESGFVTFFPADDKGQSVGGEIVQGEYSIDIITPGKKRVLVHITDPTAPASANVTKTREEANTERLSKSKRKQSGSQKTTSTKLIGNDKIVEVGSGSQRIDIPLEKSESTNEKATGAQKKSTAPQILDR